MKYYAIRNKRSKRLVSGTDYNNHCQIYADEYRPPLLLPADDGDELFIRFSQERRRIELEQRGINLRTFELIEVEINDDKGFVSG